MLEQNFLPVPVTAPSQSHISSHIHVGPNDNEEYQRKWIIAWVACYQRGHILVEQADDQWTLEFFTAKYHLFLLLFLVLGVTF